MVGWRDPEARPLAVKNASFLVVKEGALYSFVFLGDTASAIISTEIIFSTGTTALLFPKLQRRGGFARRRREIRRLIDATGRETLPPRRWKRFISASKLAAPSCNL